MRPRTVPPVVLPPPVASPEIGTMFTRFFALDFHDETQDGPFNGVVMSFYFCLFSLLPDVASGTVRINIAFATLRIRFGEEEKRVVIRAKALLATCSEVAVFSEAGRFTFISTGYDIIWVIHVDLVNIFGVCRATINLTVYFWQEDEQQEFQEKEAHLDNEDDLVDESLKMDEPETGSLADAASDQQDQQKLEVEMEEQHLRATEKKEQQHNPRRTYHNQRGATRGGGGRRGYANGRGGRGGGGGYQNGRSQYYDSGYYPRNYYNTRGRGGRSSGSAVYTNHGGHTSANVELDTSA
ncbi:hypothetical protein BHE74_00025544 [Ensete ventricosum]|nr:hypothetical protein BHE74_00025544 [Ensete ventricosum]